MLETLSDTSVQERIAAVGQEVVPRFQRTPQPGDSLRFVDEHWKKRAERDVVRGRQESAPPLTGALWLHEIKPTASERSARRCRFQGPEHHLSKAIVGPPAPPD